MSEFNIGEPVTVLSPVIHKGSGESCRCVTLDENVSGTVTRIMGEWYVVEYTIPFGRTCACDHVHSRNIYRGHELMTETFCEV